MSFFAGISGAILTWQSFDGNSPVPDSMRTTGAIIGAVLFVAAIVAEALPRGGNK